MKKNAAWLLDDGSIRQEYMQWIKTELHQIVKPYYPFLFVVPVAVVVSVKIDSCILLSSSRRKIDRSYLYLNKNRSMNSHLILQLYKESQAFHSVHRYHLYNQEDW